MVSPKSSKTASIVEKGHDYGFALQGGGEAVGKVAPSFIVDLREAHCTFVIVS